jgi:hypothetical protein
MIYNNAGNVVSRARDTFARSYLKHLRDTGDRDMSHMRVGRFATCTTRNGDLHALIMYDDDGRDFTMRMKGARMDGLQMIKARLKTTHKYYNELSAFIADELSFYNS